jgi:hypothetical protein
MQWSSNGIYPTGEGEVWQIVNQNLAAYALQLKVETGSLSLQGPGDPTVSGAGTPQIYFEMIGPRPFVEFYGTEAGAHPFSIGERGGVFALWEGNPGIAGTTPLMQWDGVNKHVDTYSGQLLRMFSDEGTTLVASIDGSNGNVVVKGGYYDYSGAGATLTQQPTATSLRNASWNQELDPFLGNRGTFSAVATNGSAVGNAWITSGGAQNETRSWDVSLDAGTYVVDQMTLTNNDQGVMIWDLDANAVAIGPVDTYSAALGYNSVASLPSFVVATAGKHTLRVSMLTKNASSTGYFARLQRIQLRRIA